MLRFFTNIKYVGKKNTFLFSSFLGTEQEPFGKVVQAQLSKIKFFQRENEDHHWPYHPFFRSLSNSESYLKDFRREGEFAFWKVNQSPHSGSSCAGTTLAHRQAKCHVMCFGSGTDVTQPQQYNTKSKTYTGYRRRKHHSSSNGTVFWESIMTLFLSHTQNNRILQLGDPLKEEDY